MALFQALVLPLAVLSLALAMLFGGKAGYVLQICGTVLAGFAVLFVLLGA